MVTGDGGTVVAVVVVVQAREPRLGSVNSEVFALEGQSDRGQAGHRWSGQGW